MRAVGLDVRSFGAGVALALGCCRAPLQERAGIAFNVVLLAFFFFVFLLVLVCRRGARYAAPLYRSCQRIFDAKVVKFAFAACWLNRAPRSSMPMLLRVAVIAHVVQRQHKFHSRMRPREDVDGEGHPISVLELANLASNSVQFRVLVFATFASLTVSFGGGGCSIEVFSTPTGFLIVAKAELVRFCILVFHKDSAIFASALAGATVATAQILAGGTKRLVFAVTCTMTLQVLIFVCAAWLARPLSRA